MKQTFNIFRKDFRHHWPEALVSWALLIVFTWNEPNQWASGHEFGESRLNGILYGSLIVLLILSWGFLVVRVIQSERLTGDQQYWITRPLNWRCLLAAKILFIVCFVNIPLLIAQVVLLSKAGFGVHLSFVPKLLSAQLELVIPILLPIAALATVTATIGQVVLVLLAIGAYIAGVAILASYIPSESFSNGSDALQETIFIGACLVTLIWQYARRETNRSRTLLVIAAEIILIVVVGTPYRTLVAYQYPLLNIAEQHPVHFVLDPETPSAPVVTADDKKDIEIRIPMLVSDIETGTVVSADGAMLTIEAPDGKRWSSGWKQVGSRLMPKQQSTQIEFEVNRDFFEKIKSSEVKVRIDFALAVFHDNAMKQVIATNGRFTVPGFGWCSIDRGYGGNSLRCLYPFRSPDILFSIGSSTITCPSTEDKPIPKGEIAHDFYGSTDAGPISPVETANLYFLNWDNSEDTSIPSICPGTPLGFSFPESVLKTRSELVINGFRISDYRLSDSYSFGTPLIIKRH